MASKYGAAAKKKVGKAMSERKKGTLKSGRSRKKVTSRKQAIAIGLSQARKAGGKVPTKKASATTRRRKTTKTAATSATRSARKAPTGRTARTTRTSRTGGAATRTTRSARTARATRSSKSQSA